MALFLEKIFPKQLQKHFSCTVCYLLLEEMSLGMFTYYTKVLGHNMTN